VRFIDIVICYYGEFQCLFCLSFYNYIQLFVTELRLNKFCYQLRKICYS